MKVSIKLLQPNKILTNADVQLTFVSPSNVIVQVDAIIGQSGTATVAV